MQTHQLKRAHKNMKRTIVARGGKRGKTSGRGGKGQSARAGNKRRPEWRDIIKRLPKLRGRGKNQNKPISDKPFIINLGQLAGAFVKGDAVTPTILVERGVVSTWSGRIPAVKILGDGEITVALKISGCSVSKTAKAAIEKAGGTIALIKPMAVEKSVTRAAIQTERAATVVKKDEGKKEGGQKAGLAKGKRQTGVLLKMSDSVRLLFRLSP